MGLLDEAIREHLNLKRRRGADPAEVERAEREALGPARRGGDPTTRAAAGQDTALPYDAQAEDEWDEAFDDDAEFPVAAPTEVLTQEPPAARRSRSEEEDRLEPESDLADEDLEDDEEFFMDPDSALAPPPEPPEAPAPPQSAPPATTGDETVEYQVGEQPPDTKEEDVLEETPEFLQDTPDHDRLWFEQRPPRDFDFDG